MGTLTRDAGVVRLLNDMETLRRFLRLYPDHHPALGPARDRIRSDAAALFDSSNASLGIAPDRVFLDQTEIGLAAGAPGSRLIRHLFNLGIAAVRLTFPEARDGLVQLVAGLAALHEPPGEPDRQALLNEAIGFGGIELVPIDLSHVQLVDEHSATRDGAREVWLDLARLLASDGVFELTGKLDEGEEFTPGIIGEILRTSNAPETLFDHLFQHLAQLVTTGPRAHKPETLTEARRFFAELLQLLLPEQRNLAVVVAARHLPLTGKPEAHLEPWVTAEFLLDAVEFMLQHEVAVPEDVQRVLHRMAAPPCAEFPILPQDLVIRARQLLVRLPANAPSPLAPPPPERAPPPPNWAAAEWVADATSSLEENSVRLHLVRILVESATLWRGDDAVQRAGLRLAEEFATALDLGDFDTASRLAPTLAAFRDSEVRRVAMEDGVAAAVRAFAASGKRDHATLVAIVVALGAQAIPTVLETLATEESMFVRKRLLEVLARHGVAAIPHLRHILSDPRWFVVRNAVFLLRKLGDVESLSVFKGLIVPGAKPQVVAEVLKALVAAEDPQWYGLLIHSIDSEDANRRAAALAVASRIPNPRVVRALLDRLQHQSGMRLREPFTIDLIRALGRMRDPSTLAALQAIADLKPWRYPFSIVPLRKEAAAAIAQLGSAEARHIAAALARDREPEVAAAARAALQRPQAQEETE